MRLAALLVLAGASASLAEKLHSFCYTALAAKDAPAKLITSTSTTTATCTGTATKYITIVKTPKAKRRTTTVTSVSTVTASTSTEIDTTTVTTAVITETSTESDSTTTTLTDSTVVTPTSTVPASSGFIPVMSSLPNAGYNGAAGQGPLKEKRAGKSDGTPQKVDCLVVDAASSCKAGTTVFRTVIHTGQRQTKTLTRTSTSLTTTYPSATTTTTVSTNATTTTVSTITETYNSTTTATSYASTTTVYGACASNNIADTVNGNVIGGIYNYAQKVGGGYSEVDGLTTAYECCVAGLFSTPYPGAVFQYRAESARCFINNINPASYPQSQTDQNWEVFQVNTGTSLAVGNLYYAVIDKVVSN